MTRFCTLLALYATGFAISSVCIAEENNLSIEFGGSLDTRYGTAIEDSRSVMKSATRETPFLIKPNLKLKAWLGDSVKFGINTEIKADIGHQILAPVLDAYHIFVSGELGDLEIGRCKALESGFVQGPQSFTAATGGIDGDYKDYMQRAVTFADLTQETLIDQKDWDTKYEHKNVFIMAPSLPGLGSAGKAAEKIAYRFKFNDSASFNIAYIPNSAGIEHIRNNEYGNGKNYKNIIAGGMKLETQKDKPVVMTMSLIGEYGKGDTDQYDIFNSTGNKSTWNIKRKGVLAAQLGANLIFQERFFLGASYGILGDSGSIESISQDKADKTVDVIKQQKPNAYFLTMGTGFSFPENKGKLSLSAISSHTRGVPNMRSALIQPGGSDLINNLSEQENKYFAVSLGVTYNITKNAELYAETALYDFDSKALSSTAGNNLKLTKKNNIAVICGAKYSF
ncbi:MAG: porin [Proteobacteria bacterium]|nr:porin [Pseudomonadota bacterium]